VASIEYEPIDPPGVLGALREIRLPLDALRWIPAWLTMRSRPTTRPRTVILLPGFGAGPLSLRVMDAFLRRCGHRARDWGLGRNTGDVRQLRARFAGVVRGEIENHGERVALVGWSLGGYIAREYAREHPDEIECVVTLGTPVIGGPRYTATAKWYRSRGHDLEAIERTVIARYEMPLRVPVTAIYSKRDGVVAWRACIDRWSAGVRHVEVDETHVGLGFAPRVLALVADELETTDRRAGSGAAADARRPPRRQGSRRRDSSEAG
jgi:pimeloyl-ACP methyl ester carboxylesterase